MNSETKKITLKRCLPILVLTALLLVGGLLALPHYGISVDEPAQRRHCLVNYAYMFPQTKTLVTDTVDFPSLSNLAEYKNRYYGIGIQFPVLFAEAATGFTMPINQVYLMRHVYTFLLYVAGACCLYALLKGVFKSTRWAVAGWLIYVVCPVVTTQAFYNIKDVVFMSLCVAALYSLFALYQKRSWPRLIAFAFLCALAINSRIIAGMIPAFGLVLLVADDLHERKFAQNWLKYLVLVGAAVAFFVIMTPASWSNPVLFLVNALRTFGNYDAWSGKVLYMGTRWPGDALPWHYIPGIIFCTIPVIYSVLILLGLGMGAAALAKRVRQHRLPGREACFMLVPVAIVALMLGYIILRRPTLYNGWRHMYFLWPCFVLFAVYALRKLCSGNKILCRVTCGLLALSMLGTGIWCVKNRLNMQVYYNRLVVASVPENFERDYWALSAFHAYRYLLDNVQGQINVYDTFGKNVLAFTDEERARITDTDAEEDAEYYIESYSGIPQSKGDERHPANEDEVVTEETMDGFVLWRLYRRLDWKG